MVGEPRKPGKFWYWLAGLLVLAGVAGAAVIGVTGISAFTRAINDMERIGIPGSAQLDLAAGGHVVYYEQREGTTVPEFGLVVARADGSSVDVRPYGGRLTYDRGDVSGVAVYTFDVDRPGPHTVAVSGTGGTIAVGPSIGRGVFGLVGGIFGAFAVVAATFMIAVTIVVVVAIRRHRAQDATSAATV